MQDLTAISGQKPVVTRRRNRSRPFKLREGMSVGCQGDAAPRPDVRVPRSAGDIALPRVRDFRGLSPNAFDGRGNYSLGLKEQIVFPEIDYDRSTTSAGLDIVIVHDGETDEEARALLKGFDFPFVKVKRHGGQKRNHGEKECHREEQANASDWSRSWRPSGRASRRSPTIVRCRWKIGFQPPG